MTEKKAPPCRLFAILARKAPVGVIFRRGPTKWVRMIKWDTRTDAVERGQWFHGRLYERRCDLSPNGSKLIYFVSKINARTIKDKAYTCAWTAISKPPWFTALALWPKGNCWHGGGLFESDQTVWLNHKPSQAIPHPDHKPKGLHVKPNPEAYGEDGPIYDLRLKRDGWQRESAGQARRTARMCVFDPPETWSRTRPSGTLKVVMSLKGIDFRSGQGPYVLDFSVVNMFTDKAMALGAATWADWDQRGRLVFARAGKLLAGVISDKDELTEKEIADFNDEEPSPIKSPGWAKAW